MTASFGSPEWTGGFLGLCYTLFSQRLHRVKEPDSRFGGSTGPHGVTGGTHPFEIESSPSMVRSDGAMTGTPRANDTDQNLRGGSLQPVDA